MTVKEIRDYDCERLRYFRDKGYAVEIIWEREWNARLQHSQNRPAGDK